MVGNQQAVERVTMLESQRDLPLCFARIKRAFEINNIQRRNVTL
jgi:hypothetical protein